MLGSRLYRPYDASKGGHIMSLPSWLQTFMVWRIEAFSTRRDAQIRFLKVQVELLRQRVPGNRVILSPAERNRLLKIGAEMDHRVHDLIDIVAVKSYRRWIREARQRAVRLAKWDGPGR